MPHLRFEYTQGLEKLADLDRFADVVRQSLIKTGECPVGGIRVRGFRANHQSVANGDEYHFLDMVLRLGEGRKKSVRQTIADALYRDAKAELRQQIGDRPFILSLEIVETDSRFSRKTWSTIHADLKAKG